MLPRPMTDDYAELIRSSKVTVAESRGTIVGVIVLAGKIIAAGGFELIVPRQSSKRKTLWLR